MSAFALLTVGGLLREARPTEQAITRTVPTWLLAMAAVLLHVVSHMRWGISPLAWLAPVPWMLWMRRTQRWRERFTLLGMYSLAVTLAIAKITTPPVPPVFALMYGVPIGLSHWAGVLLWDQIRRRTSEVWGLYAMPSLAMVFEWVSYTLTPMGVWGAAATSQADFLPLLQLASVGGIASIGFLLHWVACFVAGILAAPHAGWRRHGAILGIAILAVLLFGTWRSERPIDGPTLLVAGVVTEVGLTGGRPPSRGVLDANVETLYKRSALAAQRGAQLIAWNEGATLVRAEEEGAFLSRGERFAAQRRIDLVLAYIKLTSEHPFRFENKAVFITQEGRQHTTYFKRHPVPGETTPNDNPAPRIQRPYGVVSLAICYDHDFPEMARAQAALGAQVVVVPSSDWVGIDPLHAKLARVRAIEGGFSSFRPTRWATSMAFDPMGRVLAQLPHRRHGSHVLLAEVPLSRVSTLYARTGDMPTALAGLYLLLAGVQAVRRRHSTAR